MIFAKRLTYGGHTRLFTIEKSSQAGWEIREERDNRVIRATRCGDWHQVERTRAAFEWQVVALRDEGWIET